MNMFDLAISLLRLADQYNKAHDGEESWVLVGYRKYGCSATLFRESGKGWKAFDFGDYPEIREKFSDDENEDQVIRKMTNEEVMKEFEEEITNEFI